MADPVQGDLGGDRGVRPLPRQGLQPEPRKVRLLGSGPQRQDSLRLTWKEAPARVGNLSHPHPEEGGEARLRAVAVGPPEAGLPDPDGERERGEEQHSRMVPD